MSESQPRALTASKSLLPIALIIAADLFAFNLSDFQFSLSHFAIAMFSAQLLCALVFAKGEICPGQRGRLVKVNLYSALFWLAALFFGWQQGNLQASLAIFGLISLYCLSRQAMVEQNRKVLLSCACVCSGVGIFIQLAAIHSIEQALQIAPFAQILTGIIITALALNISRNRLQGFIALLPLLMILALALNAVVSAVLAVFAFQATQPLILNEFALMVYFIAHILLAAVLFLPILQKQKASYSTLMLALFIATSLPIWLQFALLAQ